MAVISKRRKFIYWLAKVLKIPECSVMPKPLQILRLILCPEDWPLCKGNTHFSYDAENDVYTIYGMRYSGRIFQDFSQDGLPVGAKFELIKRDNEVVWLMKIEESTGLFT